MWNNSLRLSHPELDTWSLTPFLLRFGRWAVAIACQKHARAVAGTSPACGGIPNTIPSGVTMPDRQSASRLLVRDKWSNRRPYARECCD